MYAGVKVLKDESLPNIVPREEVKTLIFWYNYLSEESGQKRSTTVLGFLSLG